MKILPTLLVSLVTIALGFLAVMQQLRGNLDFLFGSPPLEVGQTVYQFQPNDVGRIQIINNDGTRAEIVKTEESWMLTEPWKDFADARSVRSLIDFAARLQIEEVIDREEVENMADYGLKKDRIEVQFFDTSGNSLCHFRIGRYTSWRSFDPLLKTKDPTKKAPSFPTLVIHPAEEEMADYLYVCGDYANPALRTLPMRSLFSNNLGLFRDHRLFYLSPKFASKITLKEKNSEMTLIREGPGKENQWKIEKPYELATNPKAISQLVSGLSALQAGAVVDDSALALPPPIPENIAFTIGLEYFQKDGSSGTPVTALFYPPENDEAKVVPVVITINEGKQRKAVLLVPRGSGSILATLPRDVNSLRSRTLTAMTVRQVKGVTLEDFTGRRVDLTLEPDPHERADRWYARISREDAPGEVTLSYNGAANSQQVFQFFEALFKNAVTSFTNDAATSPEEYGLNRPVRRITVTPRKGNPVTYVIGEKISPKYYARRIPKGRVIEVSEEAWQAAEKGRTHPELKAVASPTTDSELAPSGLEFFGLDRPKVIKVGETSVHLGQSQSRVFFANQLDKEAKTTPHVAEIGPDQISLMPLTTFPWRGERLWNINRFEIKGLKIKKRGEPVLELTYNFYAPEPWSATRGATDVTALLNTNKAEKLIKKITDIEVQKWIGPVAENAAVRLSDPSLSIEILLEEFSDGGRQTGKLVRKLSLSEVISGPANRFFYGKSDSQQDYFLLDTPTHQRLSVDLLIK